MKQPSRQWRTDQLQALNRRGPFSIPCPCPEEVKWLTRQLGRLGRDFKVVLVDGVRNIQAP